VTPQPVPAELSTPAPPRPPREWAILLGGWLLLAIFMLVMGRANLSSPGLFYDEAVFAGMAKDFLVGNAPGHHMPGAATTEISGAPFPVFVQPYLGALKCWLLIPAFKLFGASVAVLRATNLVCAISSIGFCMLWAWRLLGLRVALLAGLLLTLDPAYFFGNALDWGSLGPSFLCRTGGFLLVLLAWRRQQILWALLAGGVLGLGFFNKIDFTILILGASAAAMIAYGRSLRSLLVERRILWLVAGLGFAVGGGLMLLRLPFIFSAMLAGDNPSQPGEMTEKFLTLRAMYDGSYFYRLMTAGGRFDQMHQLPSPVWTPLGIVLLIAILALIVRMKFSMLPEPARRLRIFLLLTAGLVTRGAGLLPGAVRIHHTTLVYPFQHLLIALAAVDGWTWLRSASRFRRGSQGLIAITLSALVLLELSALTRTQRFIQQTGGRGWWSQTLAEFCTEAKTQPNLTLVSLDWGFNEQLAFFTDCSPLEEAFRPLASGEPPRLIGDAHHVFLAHAPEFSLYALGPKFMEAMAQNTNACIQPWQDSSGQTVFYTIRFGGR
jgi:hypothetical protein